MNYDQRYLNKLFVIQCFTDLLNVNDLIDFDKYWFELVALLKNKYGWSNKEITRMQQAACSRTRYEAVIPGMHDR